MKHNDGTNGGIDVYRVGIGRDVHLYWHSWRLGRNIPIRSWFGGRPWRRKIYWGIWQAESEVIPINAARGLTANAARRRLTRRINKVMTR